MAESRSISQLIAALQDEPSWQRLREMRRPLSFLSVLRCDAWEDGHTYFLTWLLDPNPEQSSHGLGELPLRRFLALVGGAIRDLPNGERARAEEPVRRLVELLTRDNPDCTFVNAPKLTSQHSKHADSRPDLFIEFSIEAKHQSVQHVRLILENKVCAGESNRQTETYWANYSKDWLCKDHHLLGVYLTPMSSYDLKSLGEPACICKQFVQINYQMLLDQVLEPCAEESKRTQDPESALVLEQYIRALGYSKQRAEAPIMAVRERERNELLQLWEDHKQFFQQLLEAYPAGLNDGYEHMRQFRKDHEDAFVELSVSLEAVLTEEAKKQAVQLRKPLGEVPFVQRVRQLLNEANLGSDWKVGGDTRSFDISLRPFAEHMRTVHNTKFDVQLTSIYFYMDASQATDKVTMTLQACGRSRHGGDALTYGNFLQSLRERIGKRAVDAGASLADAKSARICNWTYDCTPARLDENVKVCAKTLIELCPIVSEWWKTSPK